MNYSFGEVILVNFPFTDLSTSKKRPAVIISSQSYNDEKDDVILLAITSQMRKIKYFGSLPISDWQEAGLPKESLFKPLIATIDKNYIFKKLGVISNYDSANLINLLQQIIN